MNRALWVVSGLWKGIALLDCFRLLLSSREWQERPRRSHSFHDLIDGTFLRRCACWANWVPVVVQSDPEVVPPLTYSLAKSFCCKTCKPHPNSDLHSWTLYRSLCLQYMILGSPKLQMIYLHSDFTPSLEIYVGETFLWPLAKISTDGNWRCFI